MFFFCHQKTVKNRRTLREIIRTLSLSMIFVEFFFKPVYLKMVVKNFKPMENYNSWKMYLEVKILTLDVFTHMLLSLPASTPIPPIAPAVTTLLQVLPLSLRRPWLGILGYLYFTWFVIFANVMTTLQFCNHIAW